MKVANGAVQWLGVEVNGKIVANLMLMAVERVDGFSDDREQQC